MKFSIPSSIRLSGFLVLLLLVSCAKTPPYITKVAPAVSGSPTPVEDLTLRVDARVSDPQPIETTAVGVTSVVNAESILQITCAQCHLEQSLLSIKQSRAAWEGALQEMETMGVHLTETEKAVLLDYLSGTTAP